VIFNENVDYPEANLLDFMIFDREKPLGQEVINLQLFIGWHEE
jgi:hypothetical protein